MIAPLIFLFLICMLVLGPVIINTVIGFLYILFVAVSYVISIVLTEEMLSDMTERKSRVISIILNTLIYAAVIAISKGNGLILPCIIYVSGLIASAVQVKKSVMLRISAVCAVIMFAIVIF